MARPVIAQQLYNVLIRELEVEYLPFARRYTLQTRCITARRWFARRQDHAKCSAPEGSRFATAAIYKGAT